VVAKPVAVSALIQHFRNYASAGALSALIGIVSFPLLTRNLSTEDYGMLGLTTATLTLHAIVRFYTAAREGRGQFSQVVIVNTMGWLFLSLAAIAVVVWLLFGNFVLPAFVSYPTIDQLFLAAAGALGIRLYGSACINCLRAEQRSSDVARSQIIGRCVNLLLIVVVLLLFGLTPVTVLLCLCVAECCAVGYALIVFKPTHVIRRGVFSVPLVHAMLRYGMPLMVLESLGLVLRLSDRYLIDAILGDEALGLYSASYNLTIHLEIIVLVSLVQAIRPMYLSLWERDGRAATQAFLSNGLRWFLMLGLPAVVVFSLASPHLLNLLAGERYAPGTIIIPFITFSLLLDGAMQFLGAGLYIKRNTKVLMVWGSIATVLNLVLNWFCIPAFGIAGAALVTVLSYAVFMVGVAVHAFRYLAFSVPVGGPLIMAAASAIMYLTLYRLVLPSPLVAMLVKGMISSLVLFALVLLLDSGIRQAVVQRIKLNGPVV